MTRGEDLKRDGMEQVAQRRGYEDFVADVLRVVRDLTHLCEEFTVARVRWEFNQRGLAEPSHPNAWGPAMKRAVKTGLITRTDKTVKSSYPATAHARMVPVYRRRES